MHRKGNAALIVLLLVAAVGGYYAYDQGLLDTGNDIACAKVGGNCVDSCDSGEEVDAQCSGGGTCCVPDDAGRATGPGL